jgi:hypothetical protein
MARTRKTYFRPAPGQRGQGAVEAMVSLPVFLLLICLIFQLFFLAIAQLQLQYAAFCGVRSGAVHNAEKEIIEKSVSRILKSPLLLSPVRRGTYDIQILLDGEHQKDPIGSSSETLTVKIRWRYPLVIPFAHLVVNRFLPRINGIGLPTVNLNASWTLPIEESGGWTIRKASHDYRD